METAEHFLPMTTNSQRNFNGFGYMGRTIKHHHPILGLNGRFDTIQAAILLEILEVFPDEVAKRQEIGKSYTSRLSNLNVLESPTVDQYNTSVFAQYTILSKNRESIKVNLRKMISHPSPTIQCPYIYKPFLKILDIREVISLLLSK